MKTNFDFADLGALNNLVYLKNNRVYLIQNDPNEMVVNFIYLNVDPKYSNITSVYQDTLNTAN